MHDAGEVHPGQFTGSVDSDHLRGEGVAVQQRPLVIEDHHRLEHQVHEGGQQLPVRAKGYMVLGLEPRDLLPKMLELLDEFRLGLTHVLHEVLAFATLVHPVDLELAVQRLQADVFMVPCHLPVDSRPTYTIGRTSPKP